MSAVNWRDTLQVVSPMGVQGPGNIKVFQRTGRRRRRHDKVTQAWGAPPEAAGPRLLKLGLKIGATETYLAWFRGADARQTRHFSRPPDDQEAADGERQDPFRDVA